MILDWQINSFCFSLVFYTQVFILELVPDQCSKANKQNHSSELKTLKGIFIKINEAENK